MRFICWHCIVRVPAGKVPRKRGAGASATALGTDKVRLRLRVIRAILELVINWIIAKRMAHRETPDSGTASLVQFDPKPLATSALDAIAAIS